MAMYLLYICKSVYLIFPFPYALKNWQLANIFQILLERICHRQNTVIMQNVAEAARTSKKITQLFIAIRSLREKSLFVCEASQCEVSLNVFLLKSVIALHCSVLSTFYTPSPYPLIGMSNGKSVEIRLSSALFCQNRYNI